MKKIVVLTLVIALMALAVTPAFAQSGSTNKYQKSTNGNGGTGTATNNAGQGFFAVAGTITALGGNTVTLTVVAGSYLVHEYIGLDITLQTTEDTRFLLACSYVTPEVAVDIEVTGDTDCTATQVDFTALAVGQNISAKGTADANGDGVMDWTVERITIGAALNTNYTDLDAARNQNRNGRP
jgi:uncharacterized protein YdeI (BOF family)